MLATGKVVFFIRHTRHNTHSGLPPATVDGDIKKVSCPFCKDEMPYRRIYRHLRTFHIVEKDNEVFKSIMERQGKRVKPRCNECDENFGHFAPYYKHLRNHHPSTSVNTHFCEVCGEAFINKGILKHHIKQIHEIEEEVSCEKWGCLCLVMID